MSGEIINRVAKSSVITLDLEDFCPKSKVIEFDIKQFLFEETILKEKEFRSNIKSFDFSKYKDSIVCVHCSCDAIIPMWAYMLVVKYLVNSCFKVYYGDKQTVITKISLDNIQSSDISIYKNKRVIIKGCGQFSSPEALYIAITKKLINHVKSLMFGEACSAVPIHKNK